MRRAYFKELRVWILVEISRFHRPNKRKKSLINKKTTETLFAFNFRIIEVLWWTKFVNI